MNCKTCKTTLGLTRIHADGVCDIRNALWCSQCSCHGHRSIECTKVKHVWRPRYLEELIPADVRERWGIETETPINWVKPAYASLPAKDREEKELADAEREIAESNIIEVLYSEDGSRKDCNRLDTRIRKVMNTLSCNCCPKLSSGHGKNENLIRLRKWAVTHGKKVRLIQEK